MKAGCSATRLRLCRHNQRQGRPAAARRLDRSGAPAHRSPQFFTGALMTFRSISVLLAAVLALAAMPSGLEARPLKPAERRIVPWNGLLPLCSDQGVLGRVQTRFAEREWGYWGSGLEITGFDKVRETGYRTTGIDYIPRRYCTAQALLNDQTVHTVVYSVIEDMDMTGSDVLRGTIADLTFGLVRDAPALVSHWGIDWCVTGLDRNYAYGLNCQAARP